MSARMIYSMLGLALIAGCSQPWTLPFDARPSEAAGVTMRVERLQPEPYSFSYRSGYDEPARLIVENTSEWQQVWSKIWQDSSEVPALPEIDFERELIIVVALGSRPSGGYSIFVDGARNRGDHVSVDVRSVAPDGCVVTAALTQPLDIARVPRTGLPVRFAERSVVHRCG